MSALLSGEPSDLRGRIVGVLLLAALLPLAVVAAGAWVSLGRLTMTKTREQHRAAVKLHAHAIDLYLEEKLRAIRLVSVSHRVDHLADRKALDRLLRSLNTAFPDSFVDLGVIDEGGRHLAYAGPYDLELRDYSRAEWFGEVLARGSFVSDVFLGFRRVPHFVVATRGGEGERRWVLRATINSATFDSLVRAGRFGESGEVFIVDRAGRYQTPPRRGRVLDRAPVVLPAAHQGIADTRTTVGGRRVIRTSTWVNGGRWLLVIQQDEGEVMAPAHEALMLGAVVLLLAVGLVVVSTVAATGHLTRQIDRANRQRDELSRDLLRSGKLASLGEMATGLAHEINNPLAIISAEQTNIADLVELAALPEDAQRDLLASVARCQRQVTRCSGITNKMLQFGRKTDPALHPTDIRPLLEEIVSMMSTQAAVRNTELTLVMDPDVPPVLLDPTELQQVMVNLINNALHAIEGEGAVQIAARFDEREVLVSVEDTGRGIDPEDLDRVFQPFFTTKPVGQGTGLGLSVCHGVVRGWGGSIEVESEPGAGTTMTVRLPLTEAARAAPPARPSTSIVLRGTERRGT